MKVTGREELFKLNKIVTGISLYKNMQLTKFGQMLKLQGYIKFKVRRLYKSMKRICVTVSKEKAAGGRICHLLNWEKKIPFHKNQLPASDRNEKRRSAMKCLGLGTHRCWRPNFIL